MVHRDLKLDNWFLQSDKTTVFLNDWGSACAIGEFTQFSGSIELAPQHILSAISQGNLYLPQPSDDLEMVVKCIWSRLSLEYREIPKESSTKKRAAKLLSFWALQLQPEYWQEMLKAAKELNYSRLCDGVKLVLV